MNKKEELFLKIVKERGNGKVTVKDMKSVLKTTDQGVYQIANSLRKQKHLIKNTKGFYNIGTEPSRAAKMLLKARESTSNLHLPPDMLEQYNANIKKAQLHGAVANAILRVYGHKPEPFLRLI